jgi:triosephosphate isomerase
MAISIVAGNWKMNTTLREATSLVSEMKPQLDDAQGVRTVVCPPFVSLASVADLLRGSTISVGAQNMHHEDSGAYTGEVSPLMAAELCEYVVLGHSERRQHFGETDESVNLKVKAAIRVGLKPILCVGERLDERDGGRAEALVERQLRGGLEGAETIGGLVVAYEPVWAIGTGRAATPDVAQDMMAHIRGVLTSLYGGSTASDVPLLYGGSVNAANASDYMKEPDIDGALVGGASLDADSFVEIVRAAVEARP